VRFSTINLAYDIASASAELRAPCPCDGFAALEPVTGIFVSLVRRAANMEHPTVGFSLRSASIKLRIWAGLRRYSQMLRAYSGRGAIATDYLRASLAADGPR